MIGKLTLITYSNVGKSLINKSIPLLYKKKYLENGELSVDFLLYPDKYVFPHRYQWYGRKITAIYE